MSYTPTRGRFAGRTFRSRYAYEQFLKGSYERATPRRTTVTTTQAVGHPRAAGGYFRGRRIGVPDPNAPALRDAQGRALWHTTRKGHGLLRIYGQAEAYPAPTHGHKSGWASYDVNIDRLRTRMDAGDSLLDAVSKATGRTWLVLQSLDLYPA